MLRLGQLKTVVYDRYFRAFWKVLIRLCRRGIRNEFVALVAAGNFECYVISLLSLPPLVFGVTISR